jgi:peptide deformylase
LRLTTRALAPEELATPAFAELVALMRETMRRAPGVGLAAPQIGLPLALAVIEDRAEYQSKVSAEELAARGREPIPFHVIVNPKLTVIDPTPVDFFEGCLSLDGYLARVARAAAVRVEALDEHAHPITIEARGWYARILQHEIDHLNGMIYIDRMQPRTFTTHENFAHFGGGD